jgi:hypothetical protein
VSALRRLRPQGWQSQTPSVGQMHTSRTRVSALSVMGGEGTSCAFVTGARPTSDESETREHALQMRRWRWLRRTGAGGLIVQFYRVLAISTKSFIKCKTHSAHNPSTSPASTNHVPCTVSNLTSACTQRFTSGFNEIPVCSPGTVSERVFGIQFLILILTV